MSNETYKNSPRQRSCHTDSCPLPPFLQVRILKDLKGRYTTSVDSKGDYGLTISAKNRQNTVLARKCGKQSTYHMTENQMQGKKSRLDAKPYQTIVTDQLNLSRVNLLSA